MRYIEITGIAASWDDENLDEFVDKLMDALEEFMSPNCNEENGCAEDCRMLTLGFRPLPENWDDISDEEFDRLNNEAEAYAKTSVVKTFRFPKST